MWEAAPARELAPEAAPELASTPAPQLALVPAPELAMGLLIGNGASRVAKVLDLTMEEPVLRRQAWPELIPVLPHSIAACMSQGAGDVSIFEDVIEATVFQS